VIQVGKEGADLGGAEVAAALAAQEPEEVLDEELPGLERAGREVAAFAVQDPGGAVALELGE
jgi:hypothetical protein